MAQSILSALSSELADLVARAAPVVASVDGRSRRPGSGIVIGPDLVVTADHLLEADDAVIRAGGAPLTGSVAGRDSAIDVALLRVPGLGGAIPANPVEPRVGQLVVSISRASAGGVSAGIGIIGAVGGPFRTGHGATLRQVIRTDAAARPGTSGGAIVDASGSVIAMTTAALIRGVPVGIPIGQLVEFAEAVTSGAPPQRGYLGVSVQAVRFPRAIPAGAEGGLLVLGLVPGGAADSAGLLVGDVIVEYDGHRLEHADDLHDRLAAARAGAATAVTVVRGGTLQRVDVTLGARPSASPIR